MKRPEVRAFLFDIVQACELIAQFTTGRTFEEYRADPMLRSAVERQFEIVGEALAGAVRVDLSLAEQITDAARIIAFRNRLIHGYAAIADEVVWGVVENNLSTLHREAAELLEQAGGN